MELVQHTESDAWLALSLATHLNLLPLSRQLSCITGYLWSRTLQARALSPRTTKAPQCMPGVLYAADSCTRCLVFITSYWTLEGEEHHHFT